MRELVFAALIGSTLQLGVLVYAGFATYHSSLMLSKDDKPVPNYAYPCTTTGTVLLVFGLALCAHVVESSTKERKFETIDNRRIRVIYLQQQKTVNDQTFKSCIIYGKDDRTSIKTSRRHHRHENGYTFHELLREFRKTILSFGRHSIWKVSTKTLSHVVKSFETPRSPEVYAQNYDNETDLRRIHAVLAIKTVFGTIATLSGFTLQFIGLRGMHWSISIAQLGVVFMMVLVKAWVRRRLASPPEPKNVSPGFELDWLAKTLEKEKYTSYEHWGCSSESEKSPPDWIVQIDKETFFERVKGDDSSSIPGDNTSESSGNPGGSSESKDGSRACSSPCLLDSSTEGVRQKGNDTYVSAKDRAQAIFNVRTELGSLAGWPGIAYNEAVCLSKAMEITMDALFKSKRMQDSWEWQLPVLCDGLEQRISLHIYRQGDSWKADVNEVDAALSLWLSSIAAERQKTEAPIEHRLFTDDGSKAAIEDKNRPTETEKSDRPRPHLSPGFQMKRSLGIATTVLKRDLQWWVPRDLLRILTCDVDDPDLLVASRTDGCTALDNRVPSQLNYGTSVLAITHRGSLKTLFGQELFSMFMLAVANKMDDPENWVADELQTEIAVVNGDWGDFQLRNNVLSRLVQDVHAAGLGNLGEIYASVIASLSQRFRLPRIDMVVQWGREHAERFARLEDWGNMQRTLEGLSEVVEATPLSARVEGLLMDHLRRTSFTIKFREEQEYGQTDDSYDSMAKLKAMLLERLEKMRRLRKDLEKNRKPQGNPADGEMSDLVKLFDRKTCHQPRGLLLSALFCKEPQTEDSGSQEHGCPAQHTSESVYPESFNLTALHYIALKCDKHNSALSSHHGILSKEGGERLNGLVNSKDILDRTPAHYKVTGKNQTITNKSLILLKRHGADFDAQDLLGWTPLHYACWAGGIENVRILIQEGAALDLQTNDGSTPLHYAATQGHVEEIRVLVEAGATVDMQDFYGNTPIHLAGFRGHPGIVSILLDNGSRNLRDRYGRNSLHQAVLARKKDVVHVLVRNGVSLEGRDRHGQTALSIAARKGYLDLIEDLVERGADIETQDGDKVRPLHWAALSGDYGCVRKLLDEGANVRSSDRGGMGTLHYAAWSGEFDVIKAVHEADPTSNRMSSGPTVFMCAATGGNAEALKFLAEDGANVQEDNYNPPATIWAHALEGSRPEAIPDVIRTLVSLGVNIEAREIEAGFEGQTPLMVAISFWNRVAPLPSVKALLECGADVEATDLNDRTAWQIALELDQEDVADFILSFRRSRGFQVPEWYTWISESGLFQHGE